VAAGPWCQGRPTITIHPEEEGGHPVPQHQTGPPPAPRRPAGGPWAPTAEQEAVVCAATEGGTVAVTAGAGTGKTATLALTGEALQGRRGLYIAFNRAIAAEARDRMPANMASSTAHALAFRALGYRYQQRLKAPRLPAGQVAAHLGITSPLAVTESVRLSPSSVAVQVMEMVRRFCLSAHRAIDARAHAPHVPGLDPAERHRLAEHLLPLARDAWHDLQKPDGEGGVCRLTHDHYLKMWALADPRLECDFLCLDEAQDTNPVLAELVRAQDAQKVVVGDSAQAVYGWRGAVDVLESWPADHRLELSHSWRFGRRIAAEANDWLAEVGTDLRLRGDPARESAIGPLSAPDAIVCRTNAGAVERAMAQMQAGRRVSLLGGTSGVRGMAQAARALQDGRRTSHPELMAFTSWEQVRDYVDQAPQEAGELRGLVRLVDEHGPDAVLSATGRMCAEQDAQVVCGTAHKAKGREWDTVQVDTDFREPPALADGTPGPVPRAEAMLAYVTVTRARYRLDTAGLAWIHHRTVATRARSTRPPRAPLPGARPGEGVHRSGEPRPTGVWPALDLESTYTAVLPGQGQVTITPTVKERARAGHHRTTVSGLHPLLAHKLAALDEDTRPHVELLLNSAVIAITDKSDDAPDSSLIGLIATRDRGRLITNYQGHPALTCDDVLDLAEHLRAHLNGDAPPRLRTAPRPAAAARDDNWPQTAAAASDQTSREDLRNAIALYLDQSPGTGIDPGDVAAAVVNRYGLTRWDRLDAHQVIAVLDDADPDHD
jgi:hypothetical protein